MSAITTHVLDLSSGLPAAGVDVTLEILDGDDWKSLSMGRTDADGRLKNLLGGRALEVATYRITFATGDYFASRGGTCFYPRATIEFLVTDAARHHHVPLLLSPYGFSTYRGS